MELQSKAYTVGTQVSVFESFSDPIRVKEALPRLHSFLCGVPTVCWALCWKLFKRFGSFCYCRCELWALESERAEFESRLHRVPPVWL